VSDRDDRDDRDARGAPSTRIERRASPMASWRIPFAVVMTAAWLIAAIDLVGTLARGHDLYGWNPAVLYLGGFGALIACSPAMPSRAGKDRVRDVPLWGWLPLVGSAAVVLYAVVAALAHARVAGPVSAYSVTTMMLAAGVVMCWFTRPGEPD